MFCRICKKEFSKYVDHICPYCGTDSRNPIEYTYPEYERFLIKNERPYRELLLNLNPKLFVIERMTREKISEEASQHVHARLPGDPIHKFIMELDIEILIDLKYDFLEQELKLKSSNSKPIQFIIERILWAATSKIALKQVSQIHMIERNREDYEFLPDIPDYFIDLQIELKNLKKEKAIEWKNQERTD